MKPKFTYESNEKYAYYPGSGLDFSEIENLRKKFDIKLFIHTDYLIEPYQLDEFQFGLEQKRYKILEKHYRKEIPEYTGFNWYDFWHPKSKVALSRPEDSWMKIFFIETDKNEKFKLLFLRTEAVGTYDLLNRNCYAPHVVVVQDHSLGCFWTPFGGRSKLYRSAQVADKLPEFLYVDTETKAWPGYVRCEEPEVCMDMYGNIHQKALFKRRIKNEPHNHK